MSALTLMPEAFIDHWSRTEADDRANCQSFLIRDIRNPGGLETRAGDGRGLWGVSAGGGRVGLDERNFEMINTI